ncbi:MAG TPA: hypothetical protein VJ376_08355 [Pseudomonadota bacterium]|nr:hypothetical protein [Pseudomonadota bacterium]
MVSLLPPWTNAEGITATTKYRNYNGVIFNVSQLPSAGGLTDTGGRVT